MRPVAFLVFVLSVVWCADARAQSRVEGTVRWADGTPAAGLTVAIPDLTLRTSTDGNGRYHFDDVRAGVRIAVEASIGTRMVSRRYTLVTLRVEEVDFQLAGTAANPFQPLTGPPRVISVPSTSIPPQPNEQPAQTTTPVEPSRRGAAGAAATPGQSRTQVAQNVRIEGTVRAADNSPLPGATVSIVGTTLTAVTDEVGRFTLAFTHVPAQLIVVADLSGYRSGDVLITTASFVAADFRLTPAFSEAVTVTAEVPMLNTTDDISRIKLSPAQVAVLPSLGERDIFRAFQLLPGVSGTNETSSGLFVRGGTPDQNFITYDGFRAYHVDHLFGYFSAFNMDALENVELSKGGFEAKYGGTLSSVMEITGKSGSFQKQSFSGGASLLSFNGLYETPLFGNRGSALFAVRRSFQGPLYNRILDLFSNSSAAPTAARAGGGRFGASFNTEPSSSFYDVNGKFVLKASGNDVIALALYNGNDNLDNSRSLQLPQGLFDRLAARGIDAASLGFDLSNPTLNISDVRDSGNTGVGLVWSRQWNTRLQSDVSLGYSRFRDVRDRSSQIGGNATPSNEENHVEDLTFKASLPVTLGAGHTLEGGIEITTNDVAYNFASATRVPAGGTTAPLTSVLDETGQGRLTALFVQDRWLFGSKLLVIPGVRVTRFDRVGEQYTEPRLAATFFVNGRVKFKVATGQYHQFTSQVTREDVLQGNRQFWSLADGDLVTVSESRHLIGGGSYERGNYLVDIEAFKKDLSGLTQFATRLTSASAEVDYRDYFYHGDGTAQGIEFLLQKRSGRHTGWLSYTLSNVENSFAELDPEPFPADQDQRHELKLVNLYQMAKWTLSGTWVYGSGKPYTEPGRVEPIALPFGGTVERVVAGTKNGARLPPYHRLDVALNRELPLGNSNGKGLLSVTVFNLYNRKNIWYKEFNVVEGEIAENNIRLMGLTLNVSFGVKF